MEFNFLAPTVTVGQRENYPKGTTITTLEPEAILIFIEETARTISLY